MKKLQSKKGFTLIELVVVIVILGILAMLVIPRVSAYRKQAEVKTCVGNVRTIKSAMAVYYAANGVDATSLSDLVAGASGSFLESIPKCPADPTSTTVYGITSGVVTHNSSDADHNTAVAAAI